MKKFERPTIWPTVPGIQIDKDIPEYSWKKGDKITFDPDVQPRHRQMVGYDKNGRIKVGYYLEQDGKAYLSSDFEIEGATEITPESGLTFIGVMDKLSRRMNYDFYAEERKYKKEGDIIHVKPEGFDNFPFIKGGYLSCDETGLITHYVVDGEIFELISGVRHNNKILTYFDMLQPILKENVSSEHLTETIEEFIQQARRISPAAVGDF